MTRSLALLLSAALAACAGHAHVRTDPALPELVAIGPGSGVSVVADYDQPVFYTDSAYYLYRHGEWYRSSNYRGGWARIDAPPNQLRKIDRPEAYVHVRADTKHAQLTERDPMPTEQTRDDFIRDTRPEPARPAEPAAPLEAPYPNPMPPTNQVPPAPLDQANPNRTPDVPHL